MIIQKKDTQNNSQEASTAPESFDLSESKSSFSATSLQASSKQDAAPQEIVAQNCFVPHKDMFPKLNGHTRPDNEFADSSDNNKQLKLENSPVNGHYYSSEEMLDPYDPIFIISQNNISPTHISMDQPLSGQNDSGLQILSPSAIEANVKSPDPDLDPETNSDPTSIPDNIFTEISLQHQNNIGNEEIEENKQAVEIKLNSLNKKFNHSEVCPFTCFFCQVI